MQSNYPLCFLNVFLILAATSGTATAQTDSSCGNPFKNHFGPIDYRTANAYTKALVENVHFTPGIESLTRPGTTMFRDMASDVGYTLRVFPNHHRALLTMARAAKKFGSDPAPNGIFTVNCYFERAVLFRPDDTVARALYAQYLAANARKDDAVQQLEIATTFAKDNPFSQYNIGLLYFELGKFDKALERAHAAIALGNTRPELPDKLRAINKWTELPGATSGGIRAEPIREGKKPE